MNEGYLAARASAAFVDRSDRVRTTFTGPKAGDSLNGLFTNDVSQLLPGGGQYAAALTNKGKVIADVRIFARDGSYLVDTPATAGAGFLAMIRKYVNPRLAAYRDVSAELATLGVFGPDAAASVAGATGPAAAELASLANYGQLPLSVDGAFVARVPDLGVPGFDLFGPPATIAAIRNRLRAAGLPELSAGDTHLLRIEAGRPLYGTDMDENTLAQEAALDRADLGAISFTKGCYTGQETVARVHFRGHVNRLLRGLRLSGPAAAGSTLRASDGATVGDLRSVADSPRFGWIALGYVRREIEDGTALTASAEGAECRATPCTLPFA